MQELESKMYTFFNETNIELGLGREAVKTLRKNKETGKRAVNPFEKKNKKVMAFFQIRWRTKH